MTYVENDERYGDNIAQDRRSESYRVIQAQGNAVRQAAAEFDDGAMEMRKVVSTFPKVVVVSVASMLFPLECKKPLAEIIQSSIQDHSHQHCYILLETHRLSCQQMQRKGLCQAVCQHIADAYIDDELSYLLPGPSLILEGEILNQEEDADAAYYIVRSRRKPVRPSRQIVEQKHRARANKGIQYTNHQKFNDRTVQKSFSHTPSPLFSATMKIGRCFVSK